MLPEGWERIAEGQQPNPYHQTVPSMWFVRCRRMIQRPLQRWAPSRISGWCGYQLDILVTVDASSRGQNFFQWGGRQSKIPWTLQSHTQYLRIINRHGTWASISRSETKTVSVMIAYIFRYIRPHAALAVKHVWPYASSYNIQRKKRDLRNKSHLASLLRPFIVLSSMVPFIYPLHFKVVTNSN